MVAQILSHILSCIALVEVAGNGMKPYHTIITAQIYPFSMFRQPMLVLQFSTILDWTAAIHFVASVTIASKEPMQ